jgi:hypothetical protein
VRRLFALVACVIALLVAATPAWAHEEITPKTIPTGQPTFFILSAANEKKATLTKLVLTAPAGLPVGDTTKEPAGWTVAKTDTSITWTASSTTAVKPDAFEQWGFETDGADQPGSFTFKVALSYSDGTNDAVDVPVTVSAATGATEGGPTASTKSTSQGRATAALIIAIVALVAAVLAAFGALGRGRRTTTSASPGGAATQDW